jgi:hypothetical protein
MTSILQALSCADDYDPNSLHVDRARQLILDLLPLSAVTSASSCARRWIAC